METKLRRAQWLLSDLRQYLQGRGFNMRGIKLKYSAKADEDNAKRARAFCYIYPGKRVIHSAAAIECLDARVILGLLLHEITHIILTGSPQKPDPEVADDAFILENFPEAKYRYEPITYIVRTARGTYRKRVAKNLETVSASFAARIIGS